MIIGCVVSCVSSVFLYHILTHFWGHDFLYDGLSSQKMAELLMDIYSYNFKHKSHWPSNFYKFQQNIKE